MNRNYIVTDGRTLFGYDGPIHLRDHPGIIISGQTFTRWELVEEYNSDIDHLRTTSSDIIREILQSSYPREVVDFNATMYTGLMKFMLRGAVMDCHLVVSDDTGALHLARFNRDHCYTVALEPDVLKILNNRPVQEWFEQRGENPKNAANIAMHLNRIAYWRNADRYFDEVEYMEFHSELDDLFAEQTTDVGRTLMYQHLHKLLAPTR